MTFRQPSSRPRWALSFLAAIVAVLTVVFAAATASAATTVTAETRVGASAVVVEPLVGPPEHISAGQRLGNDGQQVITVVATGVAAKSGVPLGAGVTTRKINWRPNAADPNWGLTGTHVNKHLFGNSKYALNKIDPGGNADIWRGYMQDPASRPATGTTTNGMLDIVGTFPRTGGSGSFQFGIRLAPGSDGSFDLITLLTKQ